jgi:tRNA threonylcarbamoyladenosine biosynthesis protein TsaB
MLLLAADTSGPQGSLALVRGTAAQSEVLGLVPLTGGAFSAQLVPEIARMLDRTGTSKTDLDGFAVVSGPGSFTGLRVGLAAIKGMAEILNKPIAALSLLEAVALAPQARGLVAAVLDAGRSEAYLGSYEVTGERATALEELVATPEELLARLTGKALQCVVTPDPAVMAWLAGQPLPLKQVDRPRADAIARLGMQRIEAGEVLSPEQLDATYIRRSDAEIFARR